MTRSMVNLAALASLDNDIRAKLPPGAEFVGFKRMFETPRPRVQEPALVSTPNRQALADSIRSKILYANVVGIPDESLVNMAALAKTGISAAPDKRAGLPYGIDPRELNDDERDYLGLPAQGGPYAQ